MGNKLFAEVTELTGLPEDLIGADFKALLESKGVAPESLTMQSLREVLVEYINQIDAEINAGENSKNVTALRGKLS